VGFLSQSGGLSEDVFRYAVDYGISFSKGISYGNGCDVGEVDLLQYFESDPDTRIVKRFSWVTIWEISIYGFARKSFG